MMLSIVIFSLLLGIYAFFVACVSGPIWAKRRVKKYIFNPKGDVQPTLVVGVNGILLITIVSLFLTGIFIFSVAAANKYLAAEYLKSFSVVENVFEEMEVDFSMARLDSSYLPHFQKSPEDPKKEELEFPNKKQYLEAFLTTFDSQLLVKDPKRLMEISVSEKYLPFQNCRSGFGGLVYMLAQILISETDNLDLNKKSNEAGSFDLTRCVDQISSNSADGPRLLGASERIEEALLPRMAFSKDILGFYVQQYSPAYIYNNLIVNFSDDASNPVAETVNEPLIKALITSQLAQLNEGLEAFKRFRMVLVGPIQFLLLTLFFAGIIFISERKVLLSRALSSFGEMDTKHPDVNNSYYQSVFRVRNIKVKPSSLTEREFLQQLDDSENSIVEFIKWAMPSIGFIGTVIGIGAALGDASSVVSAQGVIAQSNAIEVVTGQLGVAFDTTLIALICSIPIYVSFMFLQKKEAEILVRNLP